VGFGTGPGDRRRLGQAGAGPTRLITDLGVLRPDPDTCELVLTDLHPGVTVEQARAATGWDLGIAAKLERSLPPSAVELEQLRRLEATIRMEPKTATNLEVKR
jgi:glutaconate CoA-transferase subunit B